MNLVVWLAIGYAVLALVLLVGFRALRRWDKEGDTDE